MTADNSTRVKYEKNVWIRGPHHSKVNKTEKQIISRVITIYIISKLQVLLKKEIVNAPGITNEDARQYLGEETVDKNKV